VGLVFDNKKEFLILLSLVSLLFPCFIFASTIYNLDKIGTSTSDIAVNLESGIVGTSEINVNGTSSNVTISSDPFLTPLANPNFTDGSGTIPYNWTTGESIIYENSAENYSASGLSSHDFFYSLQKNSGEDRLVVISISWKDQEATASISNLTFNGTDMININNVTVGTQSSIYVSLWYLLDSNLPTNSGSYNVSVTVSETIKREIYIFVSEYSKVKQTAPDDSDVDSNLSAGTTSITLTATVKKSLVVAGVVQEGKNAFTNTINITNLQEEILQTSGAALGHNINVNSEDIIVGWNSLAQSEGMVGAVWQPAKNFTVDWNSTSKNVRFYIEASNVTETITLFQDFNYSSIANSAELFFNYTVDTWGTPSPDNVTMKIQLKLSNSTVFDVWTNNPTGNTSWTFTNVNVTDYINQMGTYRIILYIYIDTPSSAELFSFMWDDVGIKIEQNLEYDYILQAVSQKDYNQNIRLILYDNTNIGRLKNFTAWFYNSTTTSTQIKITDGSIISSTGNWFNLTAFGNNSIAVFAEESNPGTSLLYLKLEAVENNSIIYSCLIKLEVY
jgi:hypothetical protein